MRSPPPLVVILLAITVLLTGCNGEDPEPLVTPTPTPTPTAEPEPEPEPEPVARFEVEITDRGFDGMDNAAIFGQHPHGPEEAPANAAIDEARARLTAFLNAQLVEAETRFTMGPVGELLAPDAAAQLDEAAAAGFAVGHAREAVVHAGAATAYALALGHEAAIHAVTLRFEAAFELEGEGGVRVPLVQRGDLVFRPRDGHWLVTSADVRIEEAVAP